MFPYGHMRTDQSILPQNPRFKVAFEVTRPTPGFEAEILVHPCGHLQLWEPLSPEWLTPSA